MIKVDWLLEHAVGLTMKEIAVTNLKVGDTVKVNRYDSYPHDATMKISYEIVV